MRSISSLMCVALLLSVTIGCGDDDASSDAGTGGGSGSSGGINDDFTGLAPDIGFNETL